MYNVCLGIREAVGLGDADADADTGMRVRVRGRVAPPPERAETRAFLAGQAGNFSAVCEELFGVDVFGL